MQTTTVTAMNKINLTAGRRNMSVSELEEKLRTDERNNYSNYQQSKSCCSFFSSIQEVFLPGVSGTKQIKTCPSKFLSTSNGINLVSLIPDCVTEILDLLSW